ncbi:MAG: outer membrane protein assembly factor BamD [Bacteroidales bacterium]
MLRTPVILRLTAIASLIFVMGACSPYQKLLKSEDNELKFEKAVDYYNEGSYARSIGLLNDILPAFRGSARAEIINYYYAMAHYKQRDYILASHYFRTFASSFPRSEHVEEFLFLSAYCKYLESPRPSLDQTSTREAIGELQAFINRFPGSERVEGANSLIDELRFKLETKRFETGVMYYNIEDYTAAVTTFNNFIKDFPDTKYREEALFYIIRAQFDFADQSIPERQEERFEAVIESFQRLERQFPESPFLARSEGLISAAKNRIQSLQSLTPAISENN